MYCFIINVEFIAVDLKPRQKYLPFHNFCFWVLSFPTFISQKNIYHTASNGILTFVNYKGKNVKFISTTHCLYLIVFKFYLYLNQAHIKYICTIKIET